MSETVVSAVYDNILLQFVYDNQKHTPQKDLLNNDNIILIIYYSNVYDA